MIEQRFDLGRRHALLAQQVEQDAGIELAAARAHRQAVERGYAKFPVWANGKRGGRIRSGPPKLGEHSREILVELGFNDAEIAAMAKDGLLVLG